MHAMIDTTNNVLLARHEKYAALTGLYYIQFANVDATILKEGDNKSWSRFDAEQLRAIIASLSGAPLMPDATYAQLIAAARHAVETADVYICPFHIDEITRQAHTIDGKDTQPYRFAPDEDVPAPAEAWPMPPHTLTRSRAAASYAPAFPAGNAGAPIPLLSPEDAPERLRPRRAASPAPTEEPTPTPTPTPRKRPAPAERAPAKAHKRPAPSSKTGLVWDIADRLYAEMGTIDKQLRAAVIAECIEQGTNKSTAGTQFGRWKASK